MMSRSISIAVLLGAVVVLALAVDGASVDCRRFVFAPACRGATIKRSNPMAESIPSDLRLNGETDLFEQYQQQAEMSAPETDDILLLNQRAWLPRSNNRHRQSIQLDD